MLDLRRVSLLREVHRRGTLHAVARALSYSPSTISQQLSLLEREVGVALLERSGRRVHLTPAGLVLVDGASALLDDLERLETALDATSHEVTGTVRLAVFQSAALGIVPRALSLLADEYPQLRVEITQREPESALDEVWAREFDLVIAEEYPAHAAPRRRELDRVPLVQDGLKLGVSIDSSIHSLADAAGSAWVMEPRGTASRHWAEQQCRLAGFEPDVRFETADLQAHISLVETGHAVALLPDLVWAGRDPRVSLVTLPDDPHRTLFTAARTSAAGRPAITAVREVLARSIETAPGYAERGRTEGGHP
ncbi:LysR family transcriptional regulator [Microcella sp.]|uniref:LysR family transcriptional regulator n=1 Tax=Microcella sp. TaxID=1913979 RepID=UPI0025688C89|nr:LysR substrate-binding domain-containing protein [Microcella sp.]MBX9472052.1 LysR family transcriptional regulator [Microcella sp.]